MKYTLAAGFIALAIAAQAQDYDTRFRTYDNFQYDGSPKPYPFRSGGAGFVAGSDFISVGGLDNGVGAFAGMGDGDIALNWLLLRGVRPNRDKYQSVWYPTETGSVVGQEAYELAVGTFAKYKYKMEVLNDQIRIEQDQIKTYVTNYLGTYPNATEILFEIANEPNAYPSMPPDMYAWYYLSWRHVIKQKMDEINIERAKATPPLGMLTAKFMPGGLWTFEGMPNSFLTLLKNGLHVQALGVNFGADGYADTYQYYQDFLAALKRPLYCNWAIINGIAKQCGDYALGNVKNMQWSAPFNVLGTSQAGGPLYQKMTYGGDPVPASELIDVANLHFYPYVSKYASMTMTAQFDFWKKLVDLAADNSSSGSVYITELGNVNPGTDHEATEAMAKPVLKFLQTNGLPKATRWYWYKAQGEDPRWKRIEGFKVNPQEGAATILSRLDYIKEKLSPWITFDTPLSSDQLQELLSWADLMGQAPPRQGLRDDYGVMRELGVAYNDFALFGKYPSPPQAPANLQLTINDSREPGLATAPWTSSATLEFDWNRPDPGYDVTLAAYYNTMSTPSAGTANLVMPSLQACTQNASGAAYRFHCMMYTRDFPFGTTINVQVKASDLVNSAVSAVKQVSHPDPSTAASYCPSDLSKPLNLATPLKVDPVDLVASVDVKQSPLSFANTLQTLPTGQYSGLYMTTASAASYSLHGTGHVMSSSDLNNFSLNPSAVNIYPDGACINTLGLDDFTVNPAPSSVKADQFVYVNPPTGDGYFTIRYTPAAGGSDQYYTPGTSYPNTLTPGTTPGVLYLGDVMAPGDVLKQVQWTATNRGTAYGTFPTYFKSINFAKRNPYAAKLPPFSGNEGTVVVGGATLPAFYAAPGQVINIATNVVNGSVGFTPTLDATSIGKGIKVTSNGQYVYWTPTAAQVGQHQVTLTLKLEGSNSAYKGDVPQTFAIVVAAPAVNAAPIGDFTILQDVELSGSGFQAHTGVTTVNFGSLSVAPNKVLPSSVVFTIPQNADVGTVTASVTVGGSTSNSVSVYVKPKLNYIQDNNGNVTTSLRVGGEYTIVGYGFGTSASGIQVKINGISAIVTSASGTQLRFKVPPTHGGATAVYVTRNSETSSLPVTIKTVPAPFLMLLN